MATFAQPLAAPQTSQHTLGESTCVVSAGPWFSAVTSTAFADTAREAYLGGARDIVLDLTAVRAVDAAGTATLAMVADELDDMGCELAVASMHPGLVSWLEATPLEARLPVHDTVAGALADLLRRPV